MYHNTTQEAPEQVRLYSDKTRTQDEIIKGIIDNLKKPFSPKDIYKRFPIMNVPFTSIRRSLNTLKKEGFIVETGSKVTGLFGRPELQLKKS